jgi:hypothetical protein
MLPVPTNQLVRSALLTYAYCRMWAIGRVNIYLFRFSDELALRDRDLLPATVNPLQPLKPVCQNGRAQTARLITSTRKIRGRKEEEFFVGGLHSFLVYQSSVRMTDLPTFWMKTTPRHWQCALLSLLLCASHTNIICSFNASRFVLLWLNVKIWLHQMQSSVRMTDIREKIWGIFCLVPRLITSTRKMQF